MSQELPYNKNIENRVRKLIKDGVSIRMIFESIQELQHAPRSYTTFYKHYGHAIAEEKAELASWLGGKARESIERGSDTVLIHALRSKAGWNPTQVVDERDDEDPDEDNDPLQVLMEKLGKKTQE